MLHAVVAALVALTVAQSAPGGSRPHSCVVAAAHFAAQYHGVEGAVKPDLYERFGVDESGAASLGRLADFLGEARLQYAAYRRMSTWYVRTYLSDYDCCVILVTPVGDRQERHAVTLFRGLDGKAVKCELPGGPRLVDIDRYVTAALARDAVVVLVSAREIPSPTALHTRRYALPYLGAALAFLAAAVVGMRRLWPKKGRAVP